MYRKVRRLIGDEPAHGMIAHLVVRNDSGLQHLEVWKSENQLLRFRRARVIPAAHTVLRDAGFTQMPPEPPLERLDLIDVQLRL